MLANGKRQFSIYASLLAFGVEGYQQLLANYIRVNLAFRKKLITNFPRIGITNSETIGTNYYFLDCMRIKQNGILK